MKSILLFLIMSTATLANAMKVSEVEVVDNQKASDDEKCVLRCRILFKRRFLLDSAFAVQDEKGFMYLKKRSPWFSEKMKWYPYLAETCKALKEIERICFITSSHDPQDAALHLNFKEKISVNAIKDLTTGIPYTKEVDNFVSFNTYTVGRKIADAGLDPENKKHEKAIEQILTSDELTYHTKRMKVHRQKLLSTGDSKKLFLLLGLLKKEKEIKEYYIGIPQVHFHTYKYVTFADDLKYLINDEEGTIVNSPLCKKVTRDMIQL